MLVYKLTRSPSRFLIYVDVTGVPAKKVKTALREARMQMKKRQLVDPRTGNLTLSHNPLSSDEDIYIPVRDGRELARVENLSGPDYQDMAAIEYCKGMLYSVLQTPPEYMGRTGAIPSRSILSNDDVRAARTTLLVQKELRHFVEQIVWVDAAARGVANPRDMDFEVRMTMPSGIYALTQFEIKNSQADFASRIEPFVDKNYIRRHVFKFTDEQIAAIEKGAEKDMAAQQAAFSDVDVAIERLLSERVSEKGRGDMPTKAFMNKYLAEFRRVEDQRERETSRRHHEILERIEQLMSEDKGFGRRMGERQEFMNLVKKSAISENGGYSRPVPSASNKPRAV